MCAPAQSINALGFRNAVEAIWRDNAATVERMVKRLGMLLTWQTSARPCNLKPQQKDLTPVLCRPVEPAGENRT